jgi:hypothetical protein
MTRRISTACLVGALGIAAGLGFAGAGLAQTGGTNAKRAQSPGAGVSADTGIAPGTLGPISGSQSNRDQDNGSANRQRNSSSGGTRD